MQAGGLVRALAVAGVVVAGLALLLALAWLFRRRLIYFPARQSPPSAAELFPHAQDVELRTDDGLRLGGWFVPAQSSRTGVAVIVFNGNGGHRGFRAPLAAALADLGLDVLLFDYRGYGGNRGDPTESGLLADARAAHAYLVNRHDVDPARIVYFGESLGAGVAIALALEHPPAGLVLRSPFTSLPDVARVHYPFLVGDFLLRDRFPSLARIGRLAVPVLVIAGERDRIVPTALSRRLFEAANGPREFLLIPGADHNDFALLAGDELMAGLGRFLDRHVGRQRAASP